MKFFGLLLGFLMLIAGNLTAQELTEAQKRDYRNNPRWREMMKKRDVNLKEAITAFRLYTENRKKEDIAGWKLFERWAYKGQYYVDENWNFYEPDKTIKAFENYMQANHGKASSGNWTSMGPDIMPTGADRVSGIGRVNAVAFHPYDSSILYAGAPSGGLWISRDGGDNWETTTDNLPSLGVSAIAISHANPNHIYIGTGDRDADDAMGIGIYKSFDGGYTWEPMNEGMGNVIVGDLLLNPHNAESLIAGTSDGIYISHNAGQSWEFVELGDFWDLEYKPGDTTNVYGSNQSGGTFYRSLDGGLNWEQIDLPRSSSRTAIAVTPANPNVVYATLSSGAVFNGFVKSTNSGQTFTVQSTTPNILGRSYSGSDNEGQAWYDLCMAADPNNEDIVYVGGINVWKSENGGVNWNNVGYWQSHIHADQHDMAYSPHNGKLFIGNDGGFYEQGEGKYDWLDHSADLSIAQIYKIGQAAQSPNLIMTGHQDIGTNTHTSGGWLQSIGGDGMECAIDYTNDSVRYGELYYGDIRRSRLANTSFGSIAPSETYNSATGDYTGLWVTPYCLNEFDPEYMYAGYNDLWRASNVVSGSSGYIDWQKVTDDIYVPGKIKLVEASPADENTFFFATEGKSLFYSTNVNDDDPVFTEISGFAGSVIVDLEAHPRDKHTLYAVFNNTVYKTADLGDTWIELTENLPDVSYTSIVFDKNTDEGLYVGSDMGVFYRDSHTDGWLYFASGFPLSAFVSELEIYYNDVNPSESRLRCGTYGRGLWESPLYSSSFDSDLRISEIAVPDSANLNDTWSPQVIVKNMGQEMVTDFELTFRLNDGTLQTETWSGNLTSGSETTIEFSDVTLDKAGDNMVYANVDITDGATDEQPGNNNYTVIFNVVSTDDLPVVNFAADQTALTINDTVTFTASIEGSAEGYSWFFGDNASPGSATGIGSHEVTYSDAGSKNISLTVTSGSNEVIEAKPGYIHVYTTPEVTENPSGASICEGEDQLLTVDATGDDLEYQWLLNNQAIVGATQPYYTIHNAQIADSGNYRCEVSNEAGADTSEIALIAVKNKPDLDITVDNNVLCSGESATINVSGADSYQWSDGLGTGNEVVASPSVSASYYVTGTTNGCSTENEVHIVVPQGISIETNADTVQGCTGDIITVSVAAQGEMLDYKWFKDGNEIPGAVDYSYSITNASEADLGTYTCEVSNECFSETSEEIQIDLLPMPIAAFSYTLDGFEMQTINESQYADSYYWTAWGGFTSTEENPVFTFPNEGEKPISLTAYNPCGDSVVKDTVNVVGLADIASNDLAIYPNPSRGVVEVFLKSNMTGEASLKLISSHGKVIRAFTRKLDGKKAIFNFKAVESGVYMLRIQIDEKTYSSKIIME